MNPVWCSPALLEVAEALSLAQPMKQWTEDAPGGLRSGLGRAASSLPRFSSTKSTLSWTGTPYAYWTAPSWGAGRWLPRGQGYTGDLAGPRAPPGRLLRDGSL